MAKYALQVQTSSSDPNVIAGGGMSGSAAASGLRYIINDASEESEESGVESGGDPGASDADGRGNGKDSDIATPSSPAEAYEQVMLLFHRLQEETPEIDRGECPKQRRRFACLLFCLLRGVKPDDTFLRYHYEMLSGNAPELPSPCGCNPTPKPVTADQLSVDNIPCPSRYFPLGFTGDAFALVQRQLLTAEARLAQALSDPGPPRASVLRRVCADAALVLRRADDFLRGDGELPPDWAGVGHGHVTPLKGQV